MKEFRENVLRKGAAVNPILGFAEQGLSPAEFKRQIIQAFAPFFTNRDVLERIAIDVLAAELPNLAKVRAHPTGQLAFDLARRIYTSCQTKSADQAYRCLADAEPHVAAGRSEFWSAFYLSHSFEALGLHELKHEVFRAIGTLVEGCLQPLLRDLVGQLRISKGQAIQYADLLPLSLGNLIGELYDVTRSEIFAPGPWGVRLNQWRNMAQHYRTSVQGDRIIGWYGEPGNELKVDLSRSELIAVLRTCSAVYDGIKLARSLFCIDHIEHIQPLLPAIRERPEVRVLSFVTAIATQGFEALNVEVSDTDAQVWVRDLIDGDRKARMVHASQFVHALWTYTEAARIAVHYCEKDGRIAASFRASGETCRQFSENEIDLATYLSQMSFQVLKSAPPDSIQPKA